MSQAKEGGVSLPLEPASNRQDAVFYTWSSDWEEVWADSRWPRFRVMRNGEMRIHARKTPDSDHEVIRYTDQLEEFGIKHDGDIYEWSRKEDLFEWVNNPWFEVVSMRDGDEDLNEVFHEIGEAIAYAKRLWNEYGADGNIWED